MATYTSNYRFPKYEGTDAPDLLDQYNSFADLSDSTIKQTNDNITVIQTAFNNLETKVDGYDERITTAQTTADTAQSSASSAAEAAAEAQSTANSKAPINHASSSNQYGVGSSSQYGHLKIASSYTTTGDDTALSLSGASQMFSNLSSSISKVANRTFNSCLIIGDSWMKGYYSGTEHPTQSPGYLAALALGVPAANIYNSAVSGSGWVTGTTFQSQYNSSAHKDAELIIVLGGQNDSPDSYITAETAVMNFLSAVNSGSPNAEVHIFNMPMAYGGRLGSGITDNNPTGKMLMMSAVTTLHSTAPKNLYVHNGCYRWGDKIGSAGSDSDNVHLNASGYTCLANLMAEMIANRTGDYYPQFFGTILNTQISGGTIQRNFVSEVNGMVNICLIWDLSSASNVSNGTNVGDLPYFAQSSFVRYTGSCWGGNDAGGAFVAIGNNVSLQGIGTKPNWLFLVFSYPAGY